MNISSLLSPAYGKKRFIGDLLRHYEFVTNIIEGEELGKRKKPYHECQKCFNLMGGAFDRNEWLRLSCIAFEFEDFA